MNLIFLDTVGLIGLWDQSDQWHRAASGAYEGLSSRPFVAVTTPLVLLECANAAARRPYRKHLVELRQGLLDQNLLIAAPEDELLTAWSHYREGSQGTASVVDLVSFEVMHRVGISEAFTNDAHFRTPDL